MTEAENSDWKIYRGDVEPHDNVANLPEPPPWRDFKLRKDDKDIRAATFRASGAEVETINAALYLRRPLLITGKPGSGKSSLVYSVARELKLGPVLRWPINSRSSLQEGLYQYDALARLRDANMEWLAKQPGKQAHNEPAEIERQDAVAGDRQPGEPLASTRPEEIGRYIRLGPLGTAMQHQGDRPRALLIDEIDKSDIDLPNDLLHVFEEGVFDIPELVRAASQVRKVNVLTADRPDESDKSSKQQTVGIEDGIVRCKTFPLVVMTSNGARELPPAFLRRCLRLNIDDADKDRLTKIVEAHLDIVVNGGAIGKLIEEFFNRREGGETLAVDQLLNAVFLITRDRRPESDERTRILDVVQRELGRR